MLRSYTSPLRDRHGHLLYPGWAITNLSGPRGASYWSTGDTAPNLAQREAPWGNDPNDAPRGWTFARQALTFWMGMGPDKSMLSLNVDPRTNIVGDKLVAALDKVKAGDVAWLTKPLVDSYHTVWFELHEELILASGLTREQAARSGDAQ